MVFRFEFDYKAANEQEAFLKRIEELRSFSETSIRLDIHRIVGKGLPHPNVIMPKVEDNNPNIDLIIDIIRALPPTIKSLDLRENFFHLLSDNDLARLLKELPFKLQDLNLSCNHFQQYTSEQLQALPQDLDSLYLGRCRGVDNALDIVSHIPRRLRFLQIYIVDKPDVDFDKARLLKFVQALPHRLTTLRFNLNEAICNKTKKDKLEVLNALPPSLTQFGPLYYENPYCMRILSLQEKCDVLDAWIEWLKTNTLLLQFDFPESNLNGFPEVLEKYSVILNFLKRNRLIHELRRVDKLLYGNRYNNSSNEHLTDAYPLLADHLKRLMALTPKCPELSECDYYSEVIVRLALYHIRCETADEDDTIIDAPSSNIAIADAYLACIYRNSSAYREVSFHLGHYYHDRTVFLVAQNQMDKAKEFAKKGLHYFKACAREEESKFGELSALRSVLTGLVQMDCNEFQNDVGAFNDINGSQEQENSEIDEAIEQSPTPLNIEQALCELAQATKKASQFISSESLAKIFLRDHQLMFEQEKLGFFGDWRKTRMHTQMSLHDILQHAKGDNNRSRQVCFHLGWMNNDGSLNTENPYLPQVIRECYPIDDVSSCCDLRNEA